MVTYDSGGSTAVSVAVADVNGDGKPDVLVANECGTSSTCQPGSVGVLLGNGDGTFQAAKTYDAKYAVSCSAGSRRCERRWQARRADGEAGDNSDPGRVGVLLGNGDGTFQPVVTYSSGGNAAMSVAAADVNGDGKPDLLVGNMCINICCSRRSRLSGRAVGQWRRHLPTSGDLRPRRNWCLVGKGCRREW